METDTITSQRVKSPTLSRLSLNPKEDNCFESVLSEDEKGVDLYLKCDEEGKNEEFIDSAPTQRIEHGKEQLDQKELDLCLEGSRYIKWETGTLKNTQVESNDRNVDKEFDNNAFEYCSIKMETSNLNEELLNYDHESPVKSEIIEQEEFHIKLEEDNEDKLISDKDLDNEMDKDVKIENNTNTKNAEAGKLTQQPGNQSVLHQCPKCPYGTTHKSHLKSHSFKHKMADEIVWYSCPQCPYKTFRKLDLKRHAEIHNDLALKCSECSYETSRPRYLKQHQKIHCRNIQWLQCPECSFKTHLQWYFRRHTLKHTLAHKSEGFKCPCCPYQTGRKQVLSRHVNQHKSTDKRHFYPLSPYNSHGKRLL